MSPLSCSDTVLLTHTDYDAAGNANLVTDLRGIPTQSFFDLLGRPTQVIQASDNGNPPTGPSTTLYSYDGDDNVLTATAIIPGGNNQTTSYIYGARSRR